MEIISFPLFASGITIPEEGKRPATEAPLKYGLSNMQPTVCLAKLPDPENVVIAEGTTVNTALGATAVLNLTSLAGIPIRWIHGTDNMYRFKLNATLQGVYASDLDTLLSEYNVIVFNRDLSATPYGGFLILTIGAAGSDADIILTPACLRNGKFLATVVQDSKEF